MNVILHTRVMPMLNVQTMLVVINVLVMTIISKSMEYVEVSRAVNIVSSLYA